VSKLSKPIAVLISDIHFTVATLELAKASLRGAFIRARKLQLPLVIAGDTLDSKAIMRGEVVNALLSIQQEFSDIEVHILVGNHDMLNEKGCEHALNFLAANWHVVDQPFWSERLKLHLVPYMNSSESLMYWLQNSPAKQSVIIMHQGVQTAYLGHYQQDKTSLPKEAFKDFRVISGHYHRRQDIKCGPPRTGAIGLFSYIGNPYSLSFGEASDGPKGFQILNSDGTLTPVYTNLRKHIIMELDMEGLNDARAVGIGAEPGDLVWLKVSGSFTELEKLNKQEIGMELLGHTNFKLDKIHTDSPKLEVQTDKLTGEEILDKMIDATDEKPPEKKALKSLWRDVLS